MVNLVQALRNDCQFGGCVPNNRCIRCAGAHRIEFLEFMQYRVYDGLGPAADDVLWYIEEDWLKKHPEDRPLLREDDPEDK